MRRYDLFTRPGSAARACVAGLLGVTILAGHAALSAQAAAPAATAQAAAKGEVDPTRLVSEIRAFRANDEKNAVPKDGILFVGSSTIRLWGTATAFPGLPIINRGFGGSHLSDVNHYLGDLVQMYSPAVVVLYAGDNDLGGGKTQARVVQDFRTFVGRVLTSRRDTQIVFLSIKPSIQRWALWPTMKATNDEIKALCATDDRLHFFDVAPILLGADGKPRPEFFVEDGLHMTPAGYAAWNKQLFPLLEKLNKARTAGTGK